MNTLIVCLVIVYGIAVFDRRCKDFVAAINKIAEKDQKVFINASETPDYGIKPESVKEKTVSVAREPEEFGAAISRAASVRGFGNM